MSSRTLASLIWIHIPNDRPEKNPPKPEPPRSPRKAEGLAPSASKPAVAPLALSAEERKLERQLKAIIEKKSMIGLVQAFSVAVKVRTPCLVHTQRLTILFQHFLRSENGAYYEDLYPLISFLPRYSPTPTNNHTLSPMFSTASLNNAHMRRLRSGSIASRSTAQTGGRPSMSGERPHIPLNGTEKEEKPHVHLKLSDADIERGDVDLLPSELPPRTTIYNYLPFLLVFKPFVWLGKRILGKLNIITYYDDDTRGAFGKRKRPENLEGNIPLEIWSVSPRKVV